LYELYKEQGAKRKELKENLRNQPWGNNGNQMESLHKEIQTCVNPFPDIYEQKNKIYKVSSLSIPGESNIDLPLDFLKEQCFFTQTLFNDKYLKLIVYSALGKYKPCYKKEFKNRSKKIKSTDLKFVTKILFKEVNKWLETFHWDYPYAGSLTHLNYPRANRFPLIIVIGDSIFDFSLYYNLSRFNFKRVFIPSILLKEFINFKKKHENFNDLMGNPNFHVFWKYIEWIFDAYKGHKINLVSISESEKIKQIWEEIIEAYESYHKPPTRHLKKLQISNLDNLDLEKLIPESDPVQIYYSSGQVIGFLDKNKLSLSLDRTLKHPLEYVDFIVDLKPKHIKYPPRQLLNQKIISPSHIGHRISHSGISIKYRGKVGPINIKVLNAFDIFSLFLREGKYSCEFSDKGKYFKETLNKFKGITEIEKLENLAKFVRSEKYVLISVYLLKLHNNVTRLINGKEEKVKTLDIIKWHRKVEEVVETLKEIEVSQGSDRKCYDKDKNELKLGLIANHKSYFTFEDILRFFSEDKNFCKNLVQFCIDHEILRYGFLLRCKFCDNKDFYSLSEISNVFHCKRCGNEQKITPETLYKGEEPKMVYDLNEVVFQCFLNNGDLPILTLDYLRKKAKDETFMFLPEFKVYKNDQEYLEIDIACICDGKIIIGECKKTNKKWDEFLQKKNKFLEILEIIQPDIVVFSTLDNQKPDKANNSLATFIREIQKKHRDVKFINLNRGDLLGDSPIKEQPCKA